MIIIYMMCYSYVLRCYTWDCYLCILYTTLLHRIPTYSSSWHPLLCVYISLSILFYISYAITSSSYHRNSINSMRRVLSWKLKRLRFDCLALPCVLSQLMYWSSRWIYWALRPSISYEWVCDDEWVSVWVSEWVSDDEWVSEWLSDCESMSLSYRSHYVDDNVMKMLLKISCFNYDVEI